jgi:hypothetical protein
MFAIVISSLLAAFIFLTSGSIFHSIYAAICKKDGEYCSFFDVFFTGICTTGIVLSILSLWLPLNNFILLGLLFLCVIYWVVNLKALKQALKKIVAAVRGLPIYSQIAIFLIAATVLSLSLIAPLHYDTGLYHLQTTMWNETFRVVPGLANLHERLAFNSNFFTLTPIFCLSSLFQQHIFAINALSILCFFIWCVLASQKTASFPIKVALVIFPLLIFRTYAGNISSLSTDMLPNILILYVILKLLFFDERQSTQNISLPVIALYSVTLKLSAAPVALLFLVAIIKLITKKNYKEFSFLVITGSAIVLPWLARNIILSGYLIYPFPSIDLFNFDWKQPIELVQATKDNVTSFARVGLGPETLSWATSKWFPIWLKAQKPLQLLLFAGCIISPFLMLFIFVKRKRYNISMNAFYCWTISFSGFVFWFLSAPDFRFNFSFIILTAIIPFIVIWIAFPVLCTKNVSNAFYTILMAGLIYTIYKAPKNYSLATLYKPTSSEINGGEKNVQFVQHTIDNYIIYTPIGTDQCFGQPIPCAPIILPNLELRGKSLQEGFRIKH